MSNTQNSNKIRVLCLHGQGSNNKVFEATTAALRNELGEGFDWHFVEGTIPAPIDEDLKPFFPENDQYFSFMDTDNPESIKKAMSALQDYVDLEGPFDFITSISSQSSLTSSLLLRNAVENPEDEPLFKGAIFFSGISPFDFSAIAEGEVRSLEKSTQKLLISIPTVNIWGRNDKKHAEHAAILNSFCTPEMNETLIHNNGSSIPGAGSEQDMIRAAQMIKRVVARTILTS